MNIYDVTNKPVPFQFQCTDSYECNKLGFIARKRDDVVAMVCKDHIGWGDHFHIGVVSAEGKIAPKDADPVWTYYGNKEIVPDGPIDNTQLNNDLRDLNIIEASMMHIIDMYTFMNRKVVSADSALSRYKEDLVTSIVEWGEGCRDGKERFLESIGLEWPKTSVTLTITFEYSGDPEDISSSDIEYAVQSQLDSDVEDIYCEVDF